VLLLFFGSAKWPPESQLHHFTSGMAYAHGVVNTRNMLIHFSTNATESGTIASTCIGDVLVTYDYDRHMRKSRNLNFISEFTHDPHMHDWPTHSFSHSPIRHMCCFAVARRCIFTSQDHSATAHVTKSVVYVCAVSPHRFPRSYHYNPCIHNCEQAALAVQLAACCVSSE
jgi:hypothetical protein